MKTQLNASFKLVALVALLLFVVGCSGASTPTPSTPSLVGTWETTVTEAQAPTFAGQYEMTFAENGRVSMVNKTGTGIPTDMGTYIVKQDQLILTDERSECLKMGFPTATYKWSIEKDTLTLTAIEDRCYNRRKSAEISPFTRKTIVGTPGPTLKPMLK